jgi:hypothetical protein
MRTPTVPAAWPRSPTPAAATVLGSASEVARLREGSDEALGLRAAKENGTYPRDCAYRHYDRGTALPPNPAADRR